MRWPSKDPRDYQTRGRAGAPRPLADKVIVRGRPMGATVHVVNLRIGYVPDTDERLWRLSLPLN